MDTTSTSQTSSTNTNPNTNTNIPETLPSIWEKVSGKNITETTQVDYTYLNETKVEKSTYLVQNLFAQGTITAGSFQAKSATGTIDVKTVNSIVGKINEFCVNSFPTENKRAPTILGYKVMPRGTKKGTKRYEKILKKKRELVINYYQKTYRAYSIILSKFAEDLEGNTFKFDIGTPQRFALPAYTSKSKSNGKLVTRVAYPTYSYNVKSKKTQKVTPKNGEFAFMMSIGVAYHKLKADLVEMEARRKAEKSQTNQFMMDFGRLKGNIRAIESLFSIVSTSDPFNDKEIVPLNIDILITPFGAKTRKDRKDMATKFFNIGEITWKSYRQSASRQLQYVCENGMMSVAGTNTFEATVHKKIVIFSKKVVEEHKQIFEAEMENAEEDDTQTFNPASIPQKKGDVYVEGWRGEYKTVDGRDVFEKHTDIEGKCIPLRYSSICEAGFICDFGSKGSKSAKRSFHLPQFKIFTPNLKMDCFLPTDAKMKCPIVPTMPNEDDFITMDEPIQGEDEDNDEYEKRAVKYNSMLDEYDEAMENHNAALSEYKNQLKEFRKQLVPIAHIIKETQDMIVDEDDDDEEDSDDDDLYD